MVYRNVYFRIRSGYAWGIGWVCSEDKNGFHEEIERLFEKFIMRFFYVQLR